LLGAAPAEVQPMTSRRTNAAVTQIASTLRAAALARQITTL
jgi:hypothetical protein